MAWKRKEENYIEFLYIKLYITIGWRGSIIGASKNRLGACYARECDRAPLPPRTVEIRFFMHLLFAHNYIFCGILYIFIVVFLFI